MHNHRLHMIPGVFFLFWSDMVWGFLGGCSAQEYCVLSSVQKNK